MSMSATVLEVLATSREWQSCGGPILPRNMDEAHLRCILYGGKFPDDNDLYSGLRMREWKEVFRYELERRTSQVKKQAEFDLLRSQVFKLDAEINRLTSAKADLEYEKNKLMYQLEKLIHELA